MRKLRGAVRRSDPERREAAFSLIVVWSLCLRELELCIKDARDDHGYMV